MRTANQLRHLSLTKITPESILRISLFSSRICAKNRLAEHANKVFILRGADSHQISPPGRSKNAMGNPRASFAQRSQIQYLIARWHILSRSDSVRIAQHFNAG